MNLVLTCPSCNTRLEIGPDYFGRKVRCGGCKDTIQVPRVEADDPPSPEAASVRTDRPPEERRDGPARMAPPPWTPAAPSPFRRSPLSIVLYAVVVPLVLFGGAGAAFGVWFANAMVETSREDAAKAQISSVLVPAVLRYKVDGDDNPGGEAPDSLQDLLDSQKAGLKAVQLIDPWGKPYQYSQESAHNAPEGCDIWTETPSGKVIGNWMP